MGQSDSKSKPFAWENVESSTVTHAARSQSEKLNQKNLESSTVCHAARSQTKKFSQKNTKSSTLDPPVLNEHPRASTDHRRSSSGQNLNFSSSSDRNTPMNNALTETIEHNPAITQPSLPTSLSHSTSNSGQLPSVSGTCFPPEVHEMEPQPSTSSQQPSTSSQQLSDKVSPVSSDLDPLGRTHYVGLRDATLTKHGATSQKLPRTRKRSKKTTVSAISKPFPKKKTAEETSQSLQPKSTQKTRKRSRKRTVGSISKTFPKKRKVEGMSQSLQRKSTQKQIVSKSKSGARVKGNFRSFLIISPVLVATTCQSC